MRPPESVLFLTTGLGVGGAEAELVQLACRLAERGWKVRVVSIIEPAGRESELADAGIEVDSLGLRRGIPDPRAFSRLARRIDRARPDVLHAFMVHSNLLARLTRLVASVPVLVSTAQNVSEGGRLREWLYRLTDRWTDVTTQVSRAGGERYVAVGAVPAGRMRVITNSIDSVAYRPDPGARRELRAELGLGDSVVWLAVGRLEPQKDYPTLIDAVASSQAVDRVLIAGQGPLAAEIEGRIAERGLEGRVQLLGLRRDVPRLLNAADGFVMSSAWEGTPLALLEAAATGLPSVVTDVGGNAEVLGGVGGRLVPAGEPEALAAALDAVVAMPLSAREAMGRAARRRVLEQYDLERNVDRWEHLYRQLWFRNRQH